MRTVTFGTCAAAAAMVLAHSSFQRGSYSAFFSTCRISLLSAAFRDYCETNATTRPVSEISARRTTPCRPRAAAQEADEHPGHDFI